MCVVVNAGGCCPAGMTGFYDCSLALPPGVRIAEGADNLDELPESDCLPKTLTREQRQADYPLPRCPD